jgi:hypothetical protein
MGIFLNDVADGVEKISVKYTVMLSKIQLALFVMAPA